ncbi:MAG: NAD(P)/FAD-dependent oxidoreductase [Chitinispirillaceae bacterium]|nr:NAD(P)/FAD-dependent oxidoreductase [Chitinispirillaceae bacterium]
MSHTSSENRYDLVVIGSGFGGLTAGAFCAKAGKKVLVIERHDRPGGYAQSFARRGFQFDSSVHFTGGCAPADEERYGAIYKTLDLLHVQDRCTFFPLDPFIRIQIPGFRFDIPSGIGPFAAALSDACPNDRKGIGRLVTLCHTIDDELRRMPPKPTVWDALTTPLRFPHVFRYRSLTLKKALDCFLSDERAKTVFSSLCLCYATPPGRISFLNWTHLIISFIHERASACRGTFQKLADALAYALRSYGGELMLKTSVRKLLIENNRVKGVLLSDGRRIEASTILSNADLLSTYTALPDPPLAPNNFKRRLMNMVPTASCFAVYIGTDLPVSNLEIAHETLLMDSSSTDDCFNFSPATGPRHVLVSVPTLTDSSIAPPGNHIVSLMSLMPYEKTVPENKRKDLADALLRKACTVLPGLDRRIIVMETAIPSTFERYTKNTKGAIIGWESTPLQSGPGRPAHRSPMIKGLYHAGHWTRPGGGVYGSMISGRQAAQLILGYKKTKDFMQAMQ